MRPPFFPLMIDLKDKEILIIGGGNVASRRAKTLLECGAKITAISPDFNKDFPCVSEKILRAFEPEDIDKKFLFIIAATDKREINKLVYEISKLKKIPVNVCDCKEECDFFFPSFINYENISVSVCSAGQNPSLTRKLSDKLRSVLKNWIKKL